MTFDEVLGRMLRRVRPPEKIKASRLAQAKNALAIM